MRRTGPAWSRETRSCKRTADLNTVRRPTATRWGACDTAEHQPNRLVSRRRRGRVILCHAQGGDQRRMLTRPCRRSARHRELDQVVQRAAPAFRARLPAPDRNTSRLAGAYVSGRISQARVLNRVHSTYWPDRASAHRDIENWIRHHNQRRLHSTLDYKTPVKPEPGNSACPPLHNPTGVQNRANSSLWPGRGCTPRSRWSPRSPRASSGSRGSSGRTGSVRSPTPGSGRRGVSVLLARAARGGLARTHAPKTLPLQVAGPSAHSRQTEKLTTPAVCQPVEAVPTHSLMV